MSEYAAPTPEVVARLSGANLENVRGNLPGVLKRMRDYGIYDKGPVIAMIATILPETANTFLPIREKGGRQYLMANYDITGKNPKRAAKYGNTTPGDGYLYCGKGFIQHTWKDNYAALGKEFKRLGVPGDPVKDPDMLMQADPASIGAAWYFKTHGTADWARKALTAPDRCAFCASNGAVPGLKNKHKKPPFSSGVCKTCCWKNVRRTVNGQLNGYDRFKHLVDLLLALPA